MAVSPNQKIVVIYLMAFLSTFAPENLNHLEKWMTYGEWIYYSEQVLKDV